MKCTNCQEETSNPKFCGRSCSAIYTNKHNPRVKKKPRKTCEKCLESEVNYRSTVCRKCIEIRRDSLTVSGATSFASLKGRHPSWNNSYIRQMARNKFRDRLLEACEACGYSIHIEIAHIKPISSFSGDSLLTEVNDERNVKFLCRNCHWEFDHPAATAKKLGQNATPQCKAIGLESFRALLSRRADIEQKMAAPIRSKLCVECGAPSSGKMCNSCWSVAKRKTGWPSRDELSALLASTPYTRIGAMYGVSGVAVKKWARKYGLVSTA